MAGERIWGSGAAGARFLGMEEVRGSIPLCSTRVCLIGPTRPYFVLKKPVRQAPNAVGIRGVTSGQSNL